ncbi:MAG: type II toxin-antitoxin system VapC family toxin [Opitutales bacterium]|jgi:tRNA(fMet)-specific endonuclease VapC|nr:type II toxin-antitoxin system VapC family toxin [Opitutales bacterium]MDG2168995.1 type II toxin-antitoxin system VapC family toxin [Opitutales bacterium]
MRYLLDTDICIYIIKKKPESVFDKFRRCSIGDIGISSITYSELCFGVYKSQNVDKNLGALEGFVAPLEIAPYDETVCHYYGQVRCSLEKIGKPIGPLDMLIASHALSLGVTLVSNNIKEFDRIEGLNVENWTQLL